MAEDNGEEEEEADVSEEIKEATERAKKRHAERRCLWSRRESRSG